MMYHAVENRELLFFWSPIGIDFKIAQNILNNRIIFDIIKRLRLTKNVHKLFICHHA